jgi:hypothetical protein
MDEFVRAQKKLIEKKTSLYILISQTTKTNAKEKKRRTEKDFLKYLTLEKKEEKKETITITYVIFCLIDNNTNKKKEREKENEKKNMIHNTYDAITTSEKKNIKIDKSQKRNSLI